MYGWPAGATLLHRRGVARAAGRPGVGRPLHVGLGAAIGRGAVALAVVRSGRVHRVGPNADHAVRARGDARCRRRGDGRVAGVAVGRHDHRAGVEGVIRIDRNVATIVMSSCISATMTFCSSSSAALEGLPDGVAVERVRSAVDPHTVDHGTRDAAVVAGGVGGRQDRGVRGAVVGDVAG